MDHGSLRFIARPSTVVVAGMLVLMLVAPGATRAEPRLADEIARASVDNPSPPANPVKLVFIHHSVGQNWLADGYGNLGIALKDNKYFVSDTNYGWGPDAIGDSTDLGHWWTWFRGPSSSTYTAALYAESGQNCPYSRLAADPGGENEIVMFKSCYPNSDVTGDPNAPIPPIGSNPLRGNSDPKTVANCKGIYKDILEYFRSRPDKLFIVVTAPPMRSLSQPESDRAFNNWLVNDWLAGYPYDNVFVFDFYNVLTSNGGSPAVSDLNRETGNHHRWWNGAVQHKTDGGSNVAKYPSGDDHPNAVGSRKAAAEFLPLLNIAYNRFKNNRPVPPTPGPFSFYFAEGTCRPGFDPYLCIQNPGSAGADVKITYMSGDGKTDTQTIVVPASSRSTVVVKDKLGEADDQAHDFSCKVECTNGQAIIAERPMYFNYHSASSAGAAAGGGHQGASNPSGGQPGWTGGSDAVGAGSPGNRWFFAEGTTLPGFDEYVTVQNPGPLAANLTFHYMVEGEGEKVVTGRVQPLSRATFRTRDQVGDGKNVSLSLESDQDVVAERPMYFDYRGLASNNWTGGHDVVGGSVGAGFYFAEGTTRSGFEEWLCLMNPGTSEITVDATYLLGPGQGDPVKKSYTVPPLQRLTVSVNREIGPDKDVSVSLKSNPDMVHDFCAERSMYFNYKPGERNWDGGHDVIGAFNPSTAWFFAEGTCRPGFDPYICIQNPGASAAAVKVTYMLGNGSTSEQTLTVAAHTRSTVAVKDKLGEANDTAHDFSARVECTNGQGIVAERPMYFDYNGVWSGGHDVVGFVPNLALRLR